MGDETPRVLENKRRVLDSIGRTPASLHEVWQVHSADVVDAREPRGQAALVQADAMITANAECDAADALRRLCPCAPV